MGEHKHKFEVLVYKQYSVLCLSIKNFIDEGIITTTVDLKNLFQNVEGKFLDLNEVISVRVPRMEQRGLDGDISDPYRQKLINLSNGLAQFNYSQEVFITMIAIDSLNLWKKLRRNIFPIKNQTARMRINVSSNYNVKDHNNSGALRTEYEERNIIRNPQELVPGVTLHASKEIKRDVIAAKGLIELYSREEKRDKLIPALQSMSITPNFNGKLTIGNDELKGSGVFRVGDHEIFIYNDFYLTQLVHYYEKKQQQAALLRERSIEELPLDGLDAMEKISKYLYPNDENNHVAKSLRKVHKSMENALLKQSGIKTNEELIEEISNAAQSFNYLEDSALREE